MVTDFIMSAFYGIHHKTCFIAGIYGAGCLITEGSRGEGGYLINSEVLCAVAFHSQ